MLRALTNSLYRLAFWLDERLRWFDLETHRTDGTWLHRRGYVARYSPTALWLPIPVIVGISYGLLRWRGWALLLACAAAVLVHLAICKLAEGRRLPRLQWLLLSVLALGVFVAGWWVDGTEARPGVYPHLFGLFAVVMLTLGVPASRWWADLVIGRRRERYRAQLGARLGETSLFVKYRRPGDAAPPPPVRILGALVLVPVASPLLLAIVPAIVVVASPHEWVRIAGGAALAAWWLFLSFGHFQERLRAVQALLRQLFLVGTTSVLSLVVIAFAVTRLAGIGYVTTVLDQASGRTVLGTITLLYLILWLHDYWMQRARAEVLLGLLTDAENHRWQIPYRRDARLQIHGAGRLVVLRADPTTGFEPHVPLDVFRKIVDQLEGRVRGTKDAPDAGASLPVAERPTPRPTWDELDAAREALADLDQRSRLYAAVPAALVLAALGLGLSGIYRIEQKAALEVPAAAEEAPRFELAPALAAAAAASADGAPVYAVAGSGGGTRAALYTYALLRALHDRDRLDRVVLASGVSGGSAAAAYFAARRDGLLAADSRLTSERGGASPGPWERYREAMAADHIERVLAGVGEWRFVRGERLGRLLNESFDDHFFAAGPGEGPGEDQAEGEAGCRSLGCSGVGLVFNSSVTGSWSRRGDAGCFGERGSYWRCASVGRTGSRLVLTNLAEVDPACLASATDDWPLDFDYEVVRDPGTSLATAAALSANFPPVFSNAAVHIDRGTPEERRYWVTDGGAVENRGMISLLLALRAFLRQHAPEALGGEVPPGCAPLPIAPLTLPDLRILVAEASGLSFAYQEDRGIGAAGAGSGRIANKLIAELLREVRAAWSAASGGRATVEAVYLPMPEVLRTGFGTHWQMPSQVRLEDPAGWWRPDRPEIALDEEELRELVDRIFACPASQTAWAGESAERKEVVRWLAPDPGRRLDAALGLESFCPP